jgi:hypothetical protein
MRNISDKLCRENQKKNIIFSNFFAKIMPLVRENTVEPAKIMPFMRENTVERAKIMPFMRENTV